MIPDLRLVPFFVLVAVYVVVGKPYMDHPPQTSAAAACKAAPILYLAGYILLRGKNSVHWSADDLGAKWVPIGLILSSAGDVALMWNFYTTGVVCFGIAHVAYIAAFKRKTDSVPVAIARVFVAAVVCASLLVLPKCSSLLKAAGVLAYISLLATMVYTALQRYIVESTVVSLYGLVGAVLFLVSDSLIGCDMFLFSIPLGGLVIMGTYYAGQYGIAVSVSM